MIWKATMKRAAVILTAIALLLIGYIIADDHNAQAAVSAKKLAATYLNATEKYLNLGGKDTASFDFNINKVAQQKGAKYIWYIRADKGNPNAVTINSKTGIVTAREAGTAYIRCKITLAGGTVLRPEAKVIIRNNITRIDISNLPENNTITAGEAIDFNELILDTAGGKEKKTEGIVRWEINQDTADTGKISESGVLTPAKAGTFRVRAVCFQSKDKYNLWLKDKKANNKSITAASNWYKITVVSPVTDATAATQEELNLALASKAITKITITTQAEISLTIAAGDYADKDLVVDAPKAEIANYAVFKSISIKAIKENTWNENAKGNSFNVTSIKVRIIVNGNAEVKEIVFDRQDSVIQVEVAGKVHSITILQPAVINLTGDAEEVPVTIEESGEGSKITTSIPLKIEAKESTEVIINPGAEGTIINKNNKDTAVKVENNSREAVSITTNNTDKETIDAGQTGTSGTIKPPAPVILPPSGPSGPYLTGISIKTPATKTTYMVGETLDLSGLQLESIYSDSSRNNIDLSKVTISGFDSSHAAVSQTITLSFGGKSVTFAVVINAYPISITDPTVISIKEYDGTSAAEVDAVGTISGVSAGDDVTVTAVANYNNALVGTGKIITVVYTLSGADAAKYIPLPNYTMNTGEILPKELGISGPSLTLNKVYDGTDYCAVTAGTLSGVAAGDTVTVTAQAVYEDAAVGTGKEITVSYTISGADAAQYLSPEDNYIGNGSITKRPLSVSNLALAFDKDYDGTDEAQVDDYDVTGIINGDDIEVIWAAFYDSAVAGNGKTITVSYSLLGADAINYVAPANNTVNNRSIYPLQLTASAPTLTTSKTYDGTTSAAVIPGTLSGALIGDFVQIVANANYEDKYADSGKTITVEYALIGADKSNYYTPDDYTVTNGTINPLQLTAAPDFDTTKAYDGNNIAAEGLIVAPDNAIAGDDITLTADCYYEDEYVEINKTISVNYMLDGSDADNYLVPDDYEVIGAIERKLLTISSPLVTLSKVYDSNILAPVIAGTLTGKVTGEDVTVSAVANYETEDVGNNKQITVVYLLSGEDMANYDAPVEDIINTGSIVPKNLHASEPTVTTTKTYNGTTAAAVTPGELTDVLSGDSVTLSAIASYDNRNIGTGKEITVVYTLSGPDAGNYFAPFDYITTGSITALKLTGTPVFSPVKEYDGNTRAGELNISVTPGNKITGDTINLVANCTYEDKNVGENKKISVIYTLTGTDAGNYVAPDDYAITTGTIEKKQLTMTNPTITLTKAYNGDATASITAVGSLNGVAAGDDVIVMALASYDTPDAGNNKQITVTYTLYQSSEANYLKPVNYTVNTGSITPIQLTATAPTITVSKAYDGNVTAAVTPGTLNGVLSGDIISLAATASYNNRNAGTGKTITVVYNLIGAKAGNYTAPLNDTTTGSITAIKLNAPIINFSKTYDGNNIFATNVTVISDNMIAGDAIDLRITASYDNENAGENKTVNFTYTLSGADALNYVKPDDGSINTGIILPKQLTAQSPIYSVYKDYDGTASAKNVSMSGWSGKIEGDTINVSAIGSYNDKKPGGGKTITISFIVTGDDAANYLAPVNYVTTGSIGGGTITILVRSFEGRITKVYDGTTNVPITYTVSGLIQSDDVIIDVKCNTSGSAVGQYWLNNSSFTNSYTGSDVGNYTIQCVWEGTTGFNFWIDAN